MNKAYERDQWLAIHLTTPRGLIKQSEPSLSLITLQVEMGVAVRDGSPIPFQGSGVNSPLRGLGASATVASASGEPPRPHVRLRLGAPVS